MGEQEVLPNRQLFDEYLIRTEKEKLVLDTDTISLNEDESVSGSKAVMGYIQQEMLSKKRDTLIFIHGYNVSFKEALSAAAELSSNLNTNGKKITIVLFSWPSDGSCMPFFAYSSDRQDAAPSGAALARAFLKLSKFLNDTLAANECNQNLHLLAHSMGNYVLRYGLQEILKYTPKPPRLLNQILMMAADEDDDTFEHHYKLEHLPKIATRVNIYFNREDLAREISDKTKGNPDRLGTDGPRLTSKLPAKITQIDCTHVTPGMVEHSCYKDSPRITYDMKQELRGIEPDLVKGRLYIPELKRYRLNKIKTPK